LEFTVDTCDIVFELSCAGPPGPAGPSGAAAFTDLTDTPGSYSGQEGKLVKVDALGQELIFGDPSGTTVSWGDIGGDLPDQTDLDLALAAKADQVALTAHVGNLANPHATTPAKIGAEVEGAADAVQSDLNVHKANKANPHETTAMLVGADPVGSANAVQLDLNNHKLLPNPHGTSYVDVGADQAGSANNVQISLDVHKADLNNPHDTTPAKINAEPALGNPALNGQVLSSTTLGARSWITPPSGGASAFTDLLDTPPDYTGAQGKLVKVNPTEDGLIYGDPSGTTVSWGDIGGTLATQTDLDIALGLKADLTAVTYETLAANGDVGVGAGQLAIGDHLHPGVYDPINSAAAVQLNLDNHEADLANPHNTTPLKIGATEEAPLDAKLYSRQSAGWTESPRTPIGGLYGRFTFSGNTSATDPNSGNIKVNNADLTLATEMYISDTTRFGSLVDPNFLTWGPQDYLGVFDELLGNGAFYNIVGAIVDNIGWYTIPISPQNGSDSFITPGRDTIVTESPAPGSRIPRGGAVGQAVTKTGASDFQTGWGDFDVAGAAATVQTNLDTHEGDFSLHMTSDQNAAFDGANTPNAGNPVATMNDVTGVSTFVALTDTPPDYTSQQGKLVKVNATEDGLIFGDPSGTTVSWGDIGGDIPDQTDLDLALAAKIGASGVTYENLAANLDVGTGATQVAQGDHLHPGVYDPAGSAAAVQSDLTNHEGDFSLHMTATQNAAFDNANAPNAGNPVATMNDIPTTVPEAPQDSLPKTRVNDGVTPAWVDERVVPDGGVEGEIIIKKSSADGDAEWGNAPVGFPANWDYDNNTLEGDPTAGKFRMNNADKALAAEFYISDTSDSGLLIGDLLRELRAGQTFFVNQAGSVNTLARYELTADPVDNTTWTKLLVTFIAEASTNQFQDGKTCEFEFLGVGGGANTAIWGGIVGTLSDQEDLQLALNDKVSLASNNQFTGNNQFLGEFNVGDPGTEVNGVVIDGVTYPSVGKFNRFGTGITAEVVIHRHSSTDGSNLVFSRALSNDATHANVIGGTVLGDIIFTGWGNSSYWSGASIQGVVDGAPGVSDMPTRLDFLTSSDGSFVPALRMSIRADGTIDIAGDINMGANIITDAKVATWDAAEPGLGNPATDGYVLSSTIAGVRSWVAPGSGGGISDAPDANFGYLREGPTSTSWVRGSRVWEQVADPDIAAAVGDIWIP